MNYIVRYVGQLDKTTSVERSQLKCLVERPTWPMAQTLLRFESGDLFDYDDGFEWCEFQWLKSNQARYQAIRKQEYANYKLYLKFINIPHHMCMAYKNNVIIGWSIQDRSKFFHVYVHSNYRNLGVATKLAWHYLYVSNIKSIRAHLDAHSVIKRAAKQLNYRIKFV